MWVSNLVCHPERRTVIEDVSGQGAKNILNSEVPGRWRKLYNEKLHNLYSSNIIRVTKLRRNTWVEHVARMRDMRNAYKI
jgi:hypothetical protein